MANIYNKDPILTGDRVAYDKGSNTVIDLWSCVTYLLSTGCYKVNVGSSVNLNSIPGVLDYNNGIGHGYDYQKIIYDGKYQKLALVKNECIGHRYPNWQESTNISTINTGDLVALSTFFLTLSDEYNLRKLHNMYSVSSETVKIGTESLLLSSAYDKLSGSINNAKVNNNIKATAEIMDNIVKVLKVMDKGSSFYKDKNNKKVTDDLTYTNLPGDLIVAKNRNSLGDKVLNALSVIRNDCICYSDCRSYGVCYCYGNCNNY